jgi:hypothetical protein
MSPIQLRRLTFIILAIGFTTAIIIYFTAGPRPLNPLGYEPLETKKYIHDLELYGGKANVLAARFNDWFFGLWYGRNLAYTTAAITVLIVLFVRFVYNSMPAQTDERIAWNENRTLRRFKTYSTELEEPEDTDKEHKPDWLHHGTNGRT